MGGSHEALAMHDKGTKLHAIKLEHGVDLSKEVLVGSVAARANKNWLRC